MTGESEIPSVFGRVASNHRWGLVSAFRVCLFHLGVAVWLPGVRYGKSCAWVDSAQRLSLRTLLGNGPACSALSPVSGLTADACKF